MRALEDPPVDHDAAAHPGAEDDAKDDMGAGRAAISIAVTAAVAA